MKLRRVGIWAASSPCRGADLARGLREIRRWGLAPAVPLETQRYAGRAESTARKFLAGPDAAKVKALRQLWADNTLTDIWCVRGGYGALRLLPHLDRVLKKGRADLKVWGYSDVTVIQTYLWNRFRMPWVHSPMPTSVSVSRPRPTERRAWKQATTLTESTVTAIALRRLHRGRAHPKTGTLLGGNLASLVTLIGTPWEPKAHGRDVFLFLEDTNEAAYRIDRLLTQLAASRFFPSVKAVVLGHFTESPGAIAVVKKWAAGHRVSLYAGISSGHEQPNVPLSMGVDVELDFKKPTLPKLRVPIPIFGVTV